MADKNDPKDPLVPEQKETVEVTIEMLRQQIMGMKTKLTRNTSTTITESLTTMSQKMEENKEECEKRVNDAKKRHKRETEKRVNDYESTIRYLQEQIAEEERRSDELRGRLEECRTAKNVALSELSDARDHYDKQIKELQSCISESRRELTLLQTERERYHNAGSKLKQLEENMGKSGKELDELRQKVEELSSELELKKKVIEELETAKAELEECKERVEKDCNAVKEKLEKYVEAMKEKSNQDSVDKVLEDQLEQMKKEVAELKAKYDQEKTRSENLTGDVSGLKERAKDRESMYIRKIADLNCEVSKLQAQNKDHAKKISEIDYFKGKLKDVTSSSEDKVKELEAQLRSKVEELQGATYAQAELKSQIRELGKEKDDLKKQIEDFKVVLASCERISKQKTDTMNEHAEQIEAKDREINALKENIKVLKKTTSVLDEQLVAFETVLDEKVTEIQEAKAMQNLLDTENKDIREQLKKCRIELNEAKSKTAYTENTLQNTQSTLRNMAETKNSEVLSVVQKLEVADKRNEELLFELTKTTTQLTELESEKFELKKQVETSNAERDRYTRDLHSLLKTVVDVKEANYKLSSELQKVTEEAKASRDELEEQDAKLADMEKSLSIKEVMYNTRTQQQNKLIQHLTDQLSAYQEKHDKKKKKPLIFTPKRDKEAITPKTPLTPFPQRKFMTPTFVGTVPTPAYLEVEKLEIMKLEETKENLKTQLKTLQMNATPVTKRTQTLPAPRKEDCILLKETSNTLAAGGVVKSTGGKSHRLTETRCEANVRCKSCRETIFQGRPICKCEQCGHEFHFACSTSLGNTCGIPEKTVYEVSKYNAICPNMPLNEELTDYTEGWANVLTGKMSAPEKRYVKIEGTSLNVYISEHSLYKPVESFKLDEYTTVYFRIDTKEEAALKPLKEKFKFAMKVVFYSSAQEESFIFMFLDNKIQKRFWTRAINKYSKIRFLSGDLTLFSDMSLVSEENKENYSVNLLEKSLLEDSGSNALYVNCVTVFPHSRLYVFGCEDGLYSLKSIGAKPVKIQGPSAVYHIELLEGARLAVFVEGDRRVLATADLRTFKSCADAAECSQPQLAIEAVPKTKDCYNLSARCTSVDDTVVVAASGNHLLICKMDDDRKSLTVVKDVNIKESVTSLLIAPFSVIYGNYDVFEIDTQNFHIEEFMDTSCDAIYLLKNVFENYGNYPVSILDVTESNGSDAADPEYLLCFPDMGVFVDSYGRPTRLGEFLWTQVPLFVDYRHPFLYIFHPSNIEVQKLDKNSYQTYATTVNSKKGKKSQMMQQRTHYPVSRFYPVKLKSRSAPRYIGKGENGVVFVFNETGSTKVLELIAS